MSYEEKLNLTEVTECLEPVVVKKTKTKVLNSAIVVAICLVCAVVLAFLGMYLFTPSIEGTWLYTYDDGSGNTIDFYYDFDSVFKVETESSLLPAEPSGKEHTCTISYGTIEFPGYYELSGGSNIDEDLMSADTTTTTTDKTVTISVYNGPLYGEYTYTVIGNRLFGNRKLVLTGADGSEYTLTQTKQPKFSEYIKPAEDFVPDDRLTGDWTFEYEEFGLEYTISFNKDGTFIYDIYGAQILNCTYTVSEENIVVTYYTTEEVVETIPYTIDDNGLAFMNVLWTRAGEATPDQK